MNGQENAHNEEGKNLGEEVDSDDSDEVLTRLSLDLPIDSLADATFELLRAQYWFDAVLIVDDSIMSDMFARRLVSLCQQQLPTQRDWSAEDDNPGDNNIDHEHMAWANFQKSAIKKSPHRTAALNSYFDSDVEEEEDKLFDEQRGESTKKTKEASLMDVWKNLKVIRVSRALDQNEVGCGCKVTTMAELMIDLLL